DHEKRSSAPSKFPLCGPSAAMREAPTRSTFVSNSFSSVAARRSSRASDSEPYECDSAVAITAAASARIIPATSVSISVNPRSRRRASCRIEILPIVWDLDRRPFVQPHQPGARRDAQRVDHAFVGQFDARAVAFARRLKRYDVAFFFSRVGIARWDHDRGKANVIRKPEGSPAGQRLKLVFIRIRL